MPITQELREDGRLLYAALTDPWELADLVPLMAEARGYFADAENKIHVMVNVSQTRSVPSMSLHLLRNHLSLNYPGHGRIAVVGACLAIRAVANTLFTLAHFHHVRFFDTEDEASRYLRSLTPHGRSVMNYPS